MGEDGDDSSKFAGWIQTLRDASLQARLVILGAIVALGIILVGVGLNTARDVRADSSGATTETIAIVEEVHEVGSRSIRNPTINVVWLDTSGEARSKKIPYFYGDYKVDDKIAIRYSVQDRSARVFMVVTDKEDEDEAIDQELDASLMLDDAQEFTWIAGVGFAIFASATTIFMFWRRPSNN